MASLHWRLAWVVGSWYLACTLAHSHDPEHGTAPGMGHQLTGQHVARLAALIRSSLEHHHDSHGHGHGHHHQHHGHSHSSRKVVDMSQLLSASLHEQMQPDRLSAAVLALLDCAENPDSCSINPVPGIEHDEDDEHEHDHEEGAAAKTSLARLFWWLKPGEGGHVKPSTKAAAAVVLFVETVVGLVVPPLVSQMDGHAWWLSLLNSFAGGIFLTAGLMHLVPHCAEAQEAVDLSRWHLPSYYPLYLLLICLGYLLVFCVERVVFEGHDHGHAHGPHSCDHHHQDTAHEHSTWPRDQLLEGLLPTSSHVSSRAAAVRKRRKSGAGSEVEEGKEATPGHEAAVTVGWSGAAHPRQAEASSFNVIKGLPLLVGMSVHTALECLALGLMTRHTSFMVLLCAIAAHKGVSALALSAKFTKEGADLRQVTLLVGPFCFVAPTSILAGHLAGAFLSPSAQLLLNCLAAGTFLYVGASEILAEEFEGDARAGRRDISPVQARAIKFIMVLVAVGCIAGLGLMPHEH